MIPLWGWVIIAVVAMFGVYGVAALVFFRSVRKRVFSTHDRILNQWPLPREDAHFTADPRDPWI